MKRWSGLLAISFLLTACQSGAPTLSALKQTTQRSQIRSKSVSYSLYYGLNHAHTAANGDDGRGTLEEALSYARDKGKLDFFATSPHSHMIDEQGYQALRTTAAKFNADGKFVTLVGQEWGSLSKGGHVNIFEANSLCTATSGDWNAFYKQWLPSHKEVAWVALNHPRTDHFAPQVGKPAEQTRIATIATLGSHSEYEQEDYNSPISEKAQSYDYFLNLGYKVGAIGEQDNHRANWGTSSHVRTGVWARQLSKSEIVKAYQARRTFSTQVEGLKMWFSLNGIEMGSEAASAKSMKFAVSFSDPSKETTNLFLYGDLDGPGGAPAVTIASTEVKDGKAEWNYSYEAKDTGAKYFYLRAVSGDGVISFSSPIWVDVK